ncbi:MAG TPA: contact-dependent growth inhibition system immunity protein [Puia sp.]|nr:contact-dependent growth inhibition system immunity protein [Puia sp.]
MPKSEFPEINWRTKTIQSLDKKDYGDPQHGTTPMVRRCLELCRTPISEFTVDDLRLMIGQGFSLKYLMPLAIEQLNLDILVEANYFPGDLLTIVLQVDLNFWRENELLWRKIFELLKDKRAELATHKIDSTTFHSVFNSNDSC